ncbi:MAG: beta-N-acetylhexosaminidase [Burkholderiaceae bacterium]|nr:beta-N-acetylhexosaminidase [Burkholderiaceae bacterium]
MARDAGCGPLIIEVPGGPLDADTRERLMHPLVGGVILFERNYRSKRQLADLCREIHSLKDAPLLICVDHEGGRVQRFRSGFTVIPPMGSLGRAWQVDAMAACREATRIGRVIGSELRAVGIDLSFAPVLDLDDGVSEIIGDRAFHADPKVVTMLARSLAQGLLLAGMACCGKHFPGHGHVAADSHLSLPVDRRGRRRILSRDAAPYGWLGDVLTAVMPAHVVYPKVDARPAGFSRVWLQEILRETLGFSGAIFSDDLNMAGAEVAGDLLARARAALAAGCDLLIVCGGPNAADQLLDKLSWRAPTAFQARLASLRGR